MHDITTLNYRIWEKDVALELCPQPPTERRGGHIVFGADPVGVRVSVGVGIGVTLSCLHDIS